MALEHTFCGTWEIAGCTYEGKQEISGLEGIKFRLDETGDITWYNDLINPLSTSKSYEPCYDSANMLFNCETFDVNEYNPRLIFGSFAGFSIEFNTHTLMPSETLILSCENWYSLLCKRLKEDQAVCQEKEFSFIDALNEGYFSDVIIKSSDDLDYYVHSAILRLNGFDCSMYSQLGNATGSTSIKHIDKIKNNSYPNQIKISITIPHNNFVENTNTTDRQIKNRNLSPIYLVPPSVTDDLVVCREKNLSTSFNCLNTSLSSFNFNNNDWKKSIKKCSTSSSDSNLKENTNQNIFNFSNDLFLQPIENSACSSGNMSTSNRKPPLSPYRAKSPSPFTTPSSLDTPPSSPLTPIGVLNNLPSFMLAPILHWLYTESLMTDMDEDICEKLINFAETQPPLIKLVEPCRKYLKLIRLKKFVIDLIMDMHDILNNVIQLLNPHTIYHQPAVLLNTFVESLREGAVGCAKILQFCHIFVKDAADISRAQKHEIIKYVRTRLPIFMSQIHQLIKNILSIFVSLNQDEKTELVSYLVPEIESSLKILTNVLEEIKNSLEKMCKDLNCSHLDLSEISKNECDNVDRDGGGGGGVVVGVVGVESIELSQHQDIRYKDDLNIFPLKRPSIYDNIEEKRFISAENDLKFVLYMYEVRKMRDIYGRISTALDIIREKKSVFCEMNLADKISTVHQNLEQLILDIPNSIFIIENISDRLDDKMGWKEFKFCFKLATNQINGVIIKLLDHKPALKDPINHICKLVQKEEFTKSLIDLGLLQNSNVLTDELKINSRFYSNKISNYDYKNIKLNLIRSLCESPIVINSSLSKNALRLLHSGQLGDMEFEVHVQHHSLINRDASKNNVYGYESKASQVHTFRAHRVIVSARCEWFKKALLSGMQESINRKIIISDTSPVIFRRLLLYLYGAPIDKTVGAEQICELMLLADRYSIDDLKELCENTLNALIDEDSVLCLLGISDRYRATALKSSCLSFLSQHANLTKLDMFMELPKSIQLEVHDLIHWYGRVSEPWNDGGLKTRSNSRHSLKSPSKPKSRSRKSSPSLT